MMGKTPKTPVTDALLAMWARPDSHKRRTFALWAIFRAECHTKVGVMS